MTAPNTFVVTRAPKPNEVSISLKVWVDPEQLNQKSQEFEKDFPDIIAHLVDEQFSMGRDAVIEAIMEYVSSTQALIDATK